MTAPAPGPPAVQEEAGADTERKSPGVAADCCLPTGPVASRDPLRAAADGAGRRGGTTAARTVLTLQRAAGNAATTRALAVMRAAKRSRKPFEEMLDLYTKLADQFKNLANEVSWIGDMVVVPTAMFIPAAPLKDTLATLREFAERAKFGVGEATALIDDWVETDPKAAGGDPTRTATLVSDVKQYKLTDGGAPSAAGVAALTRDIRDWLAMIELAVPLVQATLRRVDADTPDYMREAYWTLASYYLRTILIGEGGKPVPAAPFDFARLAFLQTYYADPKVIDGYGFRRYLRTELPTQYANLRQVDRGIVLPEDLSPDAAQLGSAYINAIPQMDWRERNRMIGVVEVYDDLIALLRDASAVGAPPESIGALGTPPLTDVPALVYQLYQCKARLAMLTLWYPLEPLRSALMSVANCGKSLNPLVREEDQDRTIWLKDLNLLPQEFSKEFELATHADLAVKVDDWEKRVNKLLNEVPPAVKRCKIVAAIVEQLPFMFVAGATVARVGAWVRLFTSSRWLVAIAEGAAMTGLTALGGPSGPMRPTTAAGWAENFAWNSLWAGVGRLLFEVAGDAAGRIAATRSVIVSATTRVVLPSVTVATLQATAQQIENRVRAQGGDTTFTELLTINLIMQAMGLTIGATARPEIDTPGALAKTTPGTLAKPTPAALAARLGISEDVAALMLEVTDRMQEFMARAQEAGTRARAGSLSKDQFEALRKTGLELADWLEPRAVKLAKAGALGQMTADRTTSAFATLRARLVAMTYDPAQTITALLPQDVPGLNPLGEGPTFTYDPSRPPAALVKLRTSYQQRGYTVRPLPSGGFIVTDGLGTLVLDVLPLSAGLAANVPRTLSQVAKGPLAQAGLAKVRGQTAIDAAELEARLVAVAAGDTERQNAVMRILQNLSRFVDPASTEPWIGLDTFLRRGGDVRALAKWIAFGQSVEFSGESSALANKLLASMAGWDEEAVQGFNAMYRLRPNLTSERVQRLLDLPRDMARGVLQSLAFLEHRSSGLGQLLGPLTSDVDTSIKGAIGAITSGVSLANKYPGARLYFEVPVTDAAGETIRVIDISVRETQSTRVAGQTRTQEVEIGSFEIKEIFTKSLGKRAPQELARDIVRDYQLRARRTAPAGGSRPLFETFEWRVRRAELQQDAMDALGVTDPADPRIEREMRRRLLPQLLKALDRPELKALPQSEVDAYRNAFTSDTPHPGGLPFVEFF